MPRPEIILAGHITIEFSGALSSYFTVVVNFALCPSAM
jgi:hypothetical protein